MEKKITSAQFEYLLDLAAKLGQLDKADPAFFASIGFSEWPADATWFRQVVARQLNRDQASRLLGCMIEAAKSLPAAK